MNKLLGLLVPAIVNFVLDPVVQDAVSRIDDPIIRTIGTVIFHPVFTVIAWLGIAVAAYKLLERRNRRWLR